MACDRSPKTWVEGTSHVQGKCLQWFLNVLRKALLSEIEVTHMVDAE